MRHVIWLFFILGFNTAALAQNLPDAFFVTGVAADDVLNIRAEPSARSAIVGQLGPQAINVEVIAFSDNGKWGKVSTGEGNGWVAMRFLERSNHTPAGEVPRPMACFGTEPFWALGM
ncbi:MAG TPA: SH3 domain-containing protein, partial [Aliiroseovarius sp.]|nr:SH3 domain-containing protein [Aliiroseovarius sp.]